MKHALNSLKSKQRGLLIDVYRSRGHRNSNLWLVFSVKTGRDWILTSDRQLVHWIHNLETNRLVTSFDLAPDPIPISCDGAVRPCELTATVCNVDSGIEWHIVKSRSSEEETASLQTLFHSPDTSPKNTALRIFTDEDLKPYVRFSIRWLKAISYAAALRDQEQLPSSLALIRAVQSIRSGQVSDLLALLPNYDVSVLLGLLVKLGIEGHVALDLDTSSFGYATHWRYLNS